MRSNATSEDLAAPTRNAPRAGPESSDTRAAMSELAALQVVVDALRALLGCDRRDTVLALLAETVRQLGGRSSDAGRGPGLLPEDLRSAGDEPLYVPTDDIDAGRHLGVHLPVLLDAARQTIARLHHTRRLLADAELDPLTGLRNRRAYDRLRTRLSDCDVLVLIDLDELRAVNDTLGHLAEDQVLQQFGAVIRGELRASEHAIRFGGDEFLVVLCDDGSSRSDAFLERLRDSWEQQRSWPVEFSAGVATVSGRVSSALERSDQQLYEMKRHRAERRRDGETEQQQAQSRASHPSMYGKTLARSRAQETDDPETQRELPRRRLQAVPDTNT